MGYFVNISQTTIQVVTKKTRIFGKKQEANCAHPLRNATCMCTPVTRWELYMTIGYRVSFLDIIIHF